MMVIIFPSEIGVSLWVGKKKKKKPTNLQHSYTGSGAYFQITLDLDSHTTAGLPFPPGQRQLSAATITPGVYNFMVVCVCVCEHVVLIKRLLAPGRL